MPWEKTGLYPELGVARGVDVKWSVSARRPRSRSGYGLLLDRSPADRTRDLGTAPPQVPIRVRSDQGDEVFLKRG
jgi:hypothetical protein